MQYLKYLNIIIPIILALIILSIFVRNYKNGRIEKQIAKDPVHVNALITAAVPGTPSSYGVVNVTLDYKFKDNNGVVIEAKNVMTAVKTMDLYNYKVGNTVPVIYLRTDPNKNMLNVRNALLDL